MDFFKNTKVFYLFTTSLAYERHLFNIRHFVKRTKFSQYITVFHYQRPSSDLLKLCHDCEDARFEFVDLKRIDLRQRYFIDLPDEISLALAIIELSAQEWGYEYLKWKDFNQLGLTGKLAQGKNHGGKINNPYAPHSFFFYI